MTERQIKPAVKDCRSDESVKCATSEFVKKRNSAVFVKKRGSDGFVKSALILALGGLLAKIIGAAYRIPLTSMIGSEGIGLYQTVFPVYTAMLTLSSSGLPIALSKMVSDRNDGRGVLIKSLLFYGSVGLIFSALMFVFGDFFGKMQGVERVGTCYKALAPSVFLVSIIACFRGYFQGRKANAPTAVSQITEQIVKAFFGLVCCKYFGSTVIEKAFFAVLAVSVSEIAASAFLIIKYVILKKKDKQTAISETGEEGKTAELSLKKASLKDILRITVPVALASMALPLGHIADSFIVLNLLKTSGEKAESLFGLYSGCVPAVTGVPIAIAFGAAATAVPILSSRGKNKMANLPEIMRFTGFIAIPCSLYLALFSPDIISFLYRSLTPSDAEIASKLLTVSSLEVVLLSFLQTVNACLISDGKQKKVTLSMYAGLILKTAICFTSIFFFHFGIFGAVAGEIASLALSLSLCLCFLKVKIKLPTILYDISKELLLSIICVLWGFYLNSALKGNVWFAVLSAFVAFAYVSFSVVLFGKRGFSLRKTEAA